MKILIFSYWYYLLWFLDIKNEWITFLHKFLIFLSDFFFVDERQVSHPENLKNNIVNCGSSNSTEVFHFLHYLIKELILFEIKIRIINTYCRMMITRKGICSLTFFSISNIFRMIIVKPDFKFGFVFSKSRPWIGWKEFVA